MATETQCEHYLRHTSIFAPCCQKWFPCHRCHNDETDHELNRSEVTLIKCRECLTEQSVSEKCQNWECSRAERFDLSYCHQCLIWNDDPDRPMFHCNDCGMCRKGLRKDYWHCQTCGYCSHVDAKNSHICQSNKIHDNCPICQESLMNSQIGVIQPHNCAHLMCFKCYEGLKENNQYQCPICRKSFFNMAAQWLFIDHILLRHRMPPELSHYRADVSCNDCPHRSRGLRYHFQFHKCLYCGSYNTTLLKHYPSQRIPGVPQLRRVRSAHTLRNPPPLNLNFNQSESEREHGLPSPQSA